MPPQKYYHPISGEEITPEEHAEYHASSTMGAVRDPFTQETIRRAIKKDRVTREEAEDLEERLFEGGRDPHRP